MLLLMAPDLLSQVLTAAVSALDAIFYTTRTFDFGRQIDVVQSSDGFLGDSIGGGAAVEDPLWRGTHSIGSEVPASIAIGSLSTGGIKRSAPDSGGNDSIGVLRIFHSEPCQ